MKNLCCITCRKLHKITCSFFTGIFHRLLIDPAEEKSIELLCSLMSIIGKELDTNTNSELMNSYFWTLERIVVVVHGD